MARMNGTAIVLSEDPVLHLDVGGLLLAHPWRDRESTRSIYERAITDSESWHALRELMVKANASEDLGGAPWTAIDGVDPLVWLRLVEAVWLVNQRLAADEDPLAEAARGGLALARFRAHSVALETESADVLARLFGRRADARQGRANEAELSAYYLRVAVARSAWFDHLAGVEGSAVPVDVSDDHVSDLVLRVDGDEATRRDLTALLPEAGAARTVEVAAVQSMGRRLLLPRFMVSEVFVLSGGRGSWTTVALVGAGLSLVAAAVWTVWGWSADAGAWTNHLPLVLLVLVGAVVSGPWLYGSGRGVEPNAATWGSRLDPWCVKIPAVTLIGVAVVLALPPGWMTGVDAGAKYAGAVACVLAVLAYLALEAFVHSQGAAPRQVVRRVLAVWVLAVGQAALVTAAVVGSVGTVFLAGDECGPGSTTCPVPVQAVGTRLPLFALLVSASLAIGVFLQSLWEAEPITYPIAHLPRRGEVT